GASMPIFQRLWNALRHNRVDDEIRQELEAHFALLEEAEQSRGLNSEDAHYQARRRFGNQAAYREHTRDMDIAAWLDTFCQDIRFAFRQLLQHPGFTISAVLLLALGIGLNAAIFTLIDSVVLRDLPLPNADRLAIILERNASGGDSPPSWLDQR